MFQNIFFIPPTDEEVRLTMEELKAAAAESGNGQDAILTKEQFNEFFYNSSFEYYMALHYPKPEMMSAKISLSQLQAASVDVKAAMTGVENDFYGADAQYFHTKHKIDNSTAVERQRTWLINLANHDAAVYKLARQFVILRELTTSIVLDLTWSDSPSQQPGSYVATIMNAITIKIVRMQRHPLVAKLPRNAHLRITHQSRAHYETYRIENETAQVWCCISGAWYDEKDTVVKPIIEYNVGEHNARYILGEAEIGRGHLLDIGNIVTVHQSYEEPLRLGRIAIVPMLNRSDLKLVVLQPHEVPTLANHHGKMLTFRNNHRPNNRILYFQLCASVCMGQRYNPPRWWKRFVPLLDTSLHRNVLDPTPMINHPELLCVMADRIAGMQLEDIRKAFGKDYPFTRELTSTAFSREHLISDTILVSMNERVDTPQIPGDTGQDNASTTQT